MSERNTNVFRQTEINLFCKAYFLNLSCDQRSEMYARLRQTAQKLCSLILVPLLGTIYNLSEGRGLPFSWLEYF